MDDSKRLPDTPWHMGYVKKDEDDPRRHKARCIHYSGGNCWRNNIFVIRCVGSSHCEDYSESYEEYRKIQEERKTVKQKEADNINKYRASLENNKLQLERGNNPNKYRKVSDLNRCLICDEHLKSIISSLKQCPFCGMYYVNEQDSLNIDILNIVKAEPLFVMNIQK